MARVAIDASAGDGSITRLGRSGKTEIAESTVDPIAGDATNGHYFANDGTTFLLLVNVGGSSRDATLLTSADVTIDTVSVPAGDIAVVGPFPVDVYGSEVHVNEAHAELEVGVLQYATAVGTTITA